MYVLVESPAARARLAPKRILSCTLTGMSEWSRIGGGWLPHDEASTKEHFKEVGEDVRHERDAAHVAKADHKRRWWQFWRPRDEPSPGPRLSTPGGEGKVTREQPPHPPNPGPGTIGTGV
jgi:hypothetical protein